MRRGSGFAGPRAHCGDGAATGTAARAGGQAVQPVSFNRDIRPILSNNCFACHGPDEKQRETKFHFDTRDGAFLEEGIIVPGSAAKSVLVKMITHPDPEQRMPPSDSGHALTARQIESAAALDRRGREVGHALGVYRAGPD